MHGGRYFRFGAFGEKDFRLLQGFRLPETILHPFGGADAAQAFLNFDCGDGFRLGSILRAAAAVLDAVFLLGRSQDRFLLFGSKSGRRRLLR